MMAWHRAYVERVLAPDYDFANRHLREHLLDALLAHVTTVAALPRVQEDAAATAATDALLAGLRGMYGSELPAQAPNVPDAYFAINRALEAELGTETVSYLRTGLSRNDLDMTIYKLAARERLLSFAGELVRLRAAVLAKARAHVDTVLIARTHHQPGQPTTVAHYLAGVLGLLERDSERLMDALRRLDTCPLGAAALAGSSHPLDRHLTARLLDFREPVANTYDAVAASDWQIEMAHAACSVAVNLSRFSTDLLDWAAAGLYRLGDDLVQGSSIMPQKRNPVALEHARTHFSRALGTAQQIVFSSHNIPYGDLNDFGPDLQPALRQQYAQLSGGVDLLGACLEDGDFVLPVLARLASQTDTTATELADELVRSHGVPFQEAHALVARAVAHAQSRGVALLELTAHELQALGGPALDDDTLRAALDPTSFVGRRTGYGGPAPEVVAAYLNDAASSLEAHAFTLRDRRKSLDGALHALRVPGKEDK